MRYLLVLVFIFTLPLSALATDYRGNCAIVFQGDSTLHGFQGKARCQPFSVSIINGVVDLSQVSVAVASMDTDNAKRDKKMREMFEEKRYSRITGSAGSVALKEIRSGLKKGTDGATLAFKLKIREVVKPVSATVTKFVETDSRITAELAFTLSLADYRLQPPSVLGLISVDDKVSVKATVVLEAQ